MKKVAFILLPLQVCPGESSISALLENLLIENEKKQKIDITIFSIYSKNAIEKSKKYKNSSFEYITLNCMDKILVYLYRVIKKILKIKIPFLDRYYYKCLKKCSNSNYDYIIAEAGQYQSYEMFKNKFRKEKMVLHLHEDNYTEECKKIFSKVICVSEFLKSHIIDKFNLDRNEVFVCKNGIDLDKLCVNQNENNISVEKYEINEKDFIVLFVGRLCNKKGIIELIHAQKKVPENIKLLIVGGLNNISDIEFKRKFENEIECAKDKFINVGYINYDKIFEIYQLADIQVIPSMWEEPAGLVAIEGMANGIPIVATNSGGLVEYIDNKCAIIVEKDENVEENLSNAILDLYNNSEKRLKMGKHGIERAKKFSKEKYYDDFVKLINKF